MGWLHQDCDSDLSADFLHFGAGDFHIGIPFKKSFKIVPVSLWRRDQDCDNDLPAGFLHFFAGDFPNGIPFKSASKLSFFRFGAEIRFWSCNFCCHCVQESFSVSV